MEKGLSGPDTLREWGLLREHYSRVKDIHLKQYFNKDPKRALSFSIRTDGLLFDFSKNHLTRDTLDLLVSLAEKMFLRDRINDMFSGKKINITEDRPVLHTALRDLSGMSVFVEGKDIIPEITRVREKMRSISERIRNGKWKGFSGKKIKNVINIGIGGSHLGPKMVSEALKWYSKREINVRFVSNIDSTDLVESLNGLDPEETIFIIASKTFTTAETKTNADSAKKWIRSVFGDSDFIPKHFIALTSNSSGPVKFGIPEENILEMWDWIGGRFSLASSIGLSIMISVGYKNFERLLNGFFWMDEHFKNTRFKENIPVLMALIGIWYNNFFDAGSYAVFPYDQYLADFPAFLQQCDMESNGKSVSISRKRVGYHTSPVVWGGTGTNCQHAFFQLLHQGTRIIPADFIGFVNSLNDLGDHHTKLMANFFAQTKALAFGNSMEESANSGIQEKQAPFRAFQGNRPSNTLLFNELTPESLGMLIAMYEHKIFSQGVIWNINSFDQWGVELGKKIAVKITDDLESAEFSGKGYDNSTSELTGYFRSFRKKDESN